MQHEGYVWVAADPNSGWDRGAVDVDIDKIVVRSGDTVVRSWPVNTVRRDPGDEGTIVFSVAGDRVYLKADDPTALAADLGQLPPQAPQAPPVAAPQHPMVQDTSRPLAVKQKDPGLAVVFSFFVTGLGQLYNGEVGKAVAFFSAQVVSFFLMFILIGFLTSPALWIWSMVDAYQSAQRLNAAHGFA